MSAASEETFTDPLNAAVGPAEKNQAGIERRAARAIAGLQRSAIVPLVAMITLASGVANLYSTLDPLPPARRTLLREILPLEFFQFPRSFTLLIGFALIVSAINVYKRKRRAFYLALALSSLSVVTHLLKGHNGEQAIFPFILACALWWTRRSFTVRSSPPDWPSIALRIGVAVAAAFGYGVAGFWLLDRREFGINFDWLASIHQTMRYLTWLSWAGGARLTPHTYYAAWFLDSLYAISAAMLIYAGFALFRPIIYRYGALPQDRAAARRILAQYGRSSLDHFKLWPDKAYFMSASGRSFIAYSVGVNFAIALADPVGPPQEMAETIFQFKQFCEVQGWGVAFYQTLPDFLPAYRQSGFKKLKLGDDAIVDLTGFTLDGKNFRKIRSRNNQLERSGVRVRFYDAPAPDELIRRLKEVSDEWLRLPGRRERAFTLGRFAPGYLRATPIATAEDANGRVLAFVNVLHSYRPGEATIDLMRHRADAPNGVMDLLFAKLMLRKKTEGFTRFNLGMAPMSGFREREEASAAEKAVHGFFQRLNFLFSFSGLKAYKGKFASYWEPRYLIYRNVFDLPKIGIALGKVSELSVEFSRTLREGAQWIG